MDDAEREAKAERSFRAMAGAVLPARLDTLLKHEAGTRAGEDPEAVHDMRVASRRLRAALEAFAACYHGKEFKRVTRRTKALTDALGGVRDSDVLLERMEAYAATVPPDEAPAIARFIATIRAERETRRVAMLDALDAIDASDYAEHARRAFSHPDG